MPKTQEPPAQKAPSPPEGGGPLPGNDPPVLNSLDLSWLAETADGMRDKKLYLIRKGSGAPEIKNEEELTKERQAGVVEILALVKTDSSQPERAKVDQVGCKVKGSDPIELDPEEGWDSVFWTESAVEKFLYPYYHSQRLWNEDMDKLRDRFRADRTAVAIAHRAPSKSFALYARAGHTLTVGQVQGGRVGGGGGVAPQLKWVELSEYLEKS